MLNLPQRLKKVFEFFKPKNLATLPLKYEGDVALLVIDVQKRYCDPAGMRGNAETDSVSKRIQSLVPEFRKAGVPVYVVYFSYKKLKPHKIDFHEFTPGPDDVLIRKTDDLAFKGSNILDILQKHKRKKLLACGFNLNACVKETVLDACEKGFEVTLLRDLTGNDNSPCNQSETNLEGGLTVMKKTGIAIEQSDQALARLRATKSGPYSRSS